MSRELRELGCHRRLTDRCESGLNPEPTSFALRRTKDLTMGFSIHWKIHRRSRVCSASSKGLCFRWCSAKCSATAARAGFGDRRQAAAGRPRRSGQILDRQRSEPADHGRAVAAGAGQRHGQAAGGAVQHPGRSARRCWRSSCPRRWITPARTASCRIRPEAPGIRGSGRRPGRLPGTRRNSLHRTEKPAKFSIRHVPMCWPNDLARAIDAAGFRVGRCSGTVARPTFLRDGEGVEAQIQRW